MFTGHADLATAIEAVKLGVYDYIVKPFDPEALIWRVDKALEKSREINLDLDARVDLEERVGAQSERIRLIFYEAVQTLVNAIEAKDQYTKGHPAGSTPSRYRKTGDSRRDFKQNRCSHGRGVQHYQGTPGDELQNIETHHE
jgi:FixJ family two-component response regulator